MVVIWNPYSVILAVAIFIINRIYPRVLSWFYFLKKSGSFPLLFKCLFCISLFNCKLRCHLCLSWESLFCVPYYCMYGKGNHEYWKYCGKQTLWDICSFFMSGIVPYIRLHTWRVISCWKWSVSLIKKKRKQNKKTPQAEIGIGMQEKSIKDSSSYSI